MTLMQRRRALMAGSVERGPIIPGKTLTLQTSFTDSTSMKTAISQMLTDASIVSPAIIVSIKPMHLMGQFDLVGALIDASGLVTYPYRYNNGGIQAIDNWTAFEHKGNVGDKFYVVSSDPNSVSGDTIPGKTLTFSHNVSNGQGLSTEINSLIANTQTTGTGLLMTAIPKTSWISRSFIALAIQNSVVYGKGMRWDGTETGFKSLTSPYDFKASSGNNIYLVEVKP